MFLKLSVRRMRFFSYNACLSVLAVAGFFLILSSCQAWVGSATEPQIKLVKLFPPTYPPLARATRIEGEVELTLNLQKDGTVENVTEVKGHPLLVQASIDSAQKSQFVCGNCSEYLTAYKLIYTYRLWESSCEDELPSTHGLHIEPLPPLTIHSKNHVTLFDHAVVFCDPEGIVSRRRSAKCFYLWKCG